MGDAAHTPQYGFVIDQRKCIGCHACTVACKSENGVPVGSFRTWVKYVEKGTFPTVRRHFTVLRCNHCDRAPCVAICPVNALHKRPDAIVDLDRDACIGCRACMQACPYDALYLNADTGTAEKCHYCAHRTELGLEPACVVVCPERAIVAGDVSDEESPIARLIREQAVEQRKVEKGTRPRVWYVDALPEALTPNSSREPTQYLWSDRRNPPPPVPQGFEPPSDVVATLDVDHAPVWGWHIWTYLVTKNLSAGAMLVAPFLALSGLPGDARAQLVPETTALVFLGITLFLLVHDLGRPERFLRLLLRPNTTSWLVRGAWVLTAFGGLSVVALALRLLGETRPAEYVRWLNLPVAAFASGYTAYLFAQCRGRDLWIERGLLPKLVLRAALLGIALGVLLAGGAGQAMLLAASYVVVLAALLFVEHRNVQRSRDGDRAHALLVASGAPRREALAALGAAALLLIGAGLGGPAAAWCGAAALTLTLVGQLDHEKAWVEAGQAVPLS